MKNLIDVIAVVNNDKDEAIIRNAELKQEIYVTILNELDKDDRKNAFTIKSDWGARETPFILLSINGKASKCFYKEASANPIQDLINYLNDAVFEGE